MKAENQSSNITKKVWVEPTLEIISEVIAGNNNHINDENVSSSPGNAS